MVKSTVLLDFSLKKNISEATLLVFAGSPTTSCLRDPLQVYRPSVFGSIPSSGSLLCVTVAPQVLLYACAVVAGVEFADFGTGVYHFSVGAAVRNPWGGGTVEPPRRTTKAGEGRYGIGSISPSLKGKHQTKAQASALGELFSRHPLGFVREVDNYGSAQTPIVGSQIEAFQGREGHGRCAGVPRGLSENLKSNGFASGKRC